MTSSSTPDPIGTPVLSIRGLTAGYGDVVVLRDVDLDVAGGERVGILGPNGAGKSTLLRCIAGLHAPSSGSIRVEGRPAVEACGAIAYLAQRPAIDGDYPVQVRDVVAFGRYPHRGPVGRLRRDDRDAVTLAMDRLGLTERARSRFSELSGGLQQRVLLARALAQQAPLIVLDEVYAGVDLATTGVIDDELARLASEGRAILVVHHGSTELRERYDRLILIRGRVVADGPPDEVLRQDVLDRAYGEGLAPLSGAAG